MTPILYPAGSAEPKQQVAPANAKSGLHPPGNSSLF